MFRASNKTKSQVCEKGPVTSCGATIDGLNVGERSHSDSETSAAPQLWGNTIHSNRDGIGSFLFNLTLTFMSQKELLKCKLLFYSKWCVGAVEKLL